MKKHLKKEQSWFCVKVVYDKLLILLAKEITYRSNQQEKSKKRLKI